MSAIEDRKRVDRARGDGAAARRAGKPHGANPYRGNTPLVRMLHDEWAMGHRDEDMRLKALKGAK